MDNILYTALDNYYNALSKLGYISYSEVNRILVLIFISELSSKCIISEEDSKIISKALDCLCYTSSCIIPLFEKNFTDSIFDDNC